MNSEDEESNQTSSLDTLLEKVTVHWRDENDSHNHTAVHCGITVSTAMIVHGLLIVMFGGSWLLLLSFYGYEYPYGPNLRQSQTLNLTHSSV
jgi:hypothetical protein